MIEIFNFKIEDGIMKMNFLFDFSTNQPGYIEIDIATRVILYINCPDDLEDIEGNKVRSKIFQMYDDGYRFPNANFDIHWC